jgi:phosphoglycolate phosphatase
MKITNVSRNRNRTLLIGGAGGAACPTTPLAFPHIIFDLDGTLVDSLPGIEWSARQALAACGAGPLLCDLGPLLGPPIRSILAQATGIAAPHRLDALERAFRYSYDTQGWRQTVCFAGTLETLDRLSAAGATLWVATNKNRFATGKILSQLGLGRFFREVACRDSRTPVFSTKAEMLIHLMDRRRLAPSECLMVGDTREDADAARAAGIPCAILRHVAPGPEGTPLPPVFVCPAENTGGKTAGATGWNGLLTRVWVNQ